MAEQIFRHFSLRHIQVVCHVRKNLSECANADALVRWNREVMFSAWIFEVRRMWLAQLTLLCGSGHVMC